MSIFGIKISKAGFPVGTTDDENLVFNSAYFTLKQKKFDSFPTTVTILDGTYNRTVTFTHNLGYKPAYEITCQDVGGAFFKVPGVSYNGVTKGIIFDITNNSLTAKVGSNALAVGDYTLKILCKIYVDEELQ